MEEITVEQARKITGYNAEWIRRLIREGQIKAVKRSSIWFINVQSLKDYAERQGKRLAWS